MKLKQERYRRPYFKVNEPTLYPQKRHPRRLPSLLAASAAALRYYSEASGFVLSLLKLCQNKAWEPAATNGSDVVHELEADIDWVGGYRLDSYVFVEVHAHWLML